MSRKIHVLIFALGALLLTQSVNSEPLRSKENLRHERVLLPLCTPETSQLALIGYAMVADEETRLGIVFIYDDAQTQREVDYIELYDVTGDLLLVSWIDRFGIRQVAMDRGLLREEDPNVEGILVLITDGTAL